MSDETPGMVAAGGSTVEISWGGGAGAVIGLLVGAVAGFKAHGILGVI